MKQEDFITIRQFIRERNVDISFIRKFLKTIPDSKIKRTPADLRCKCGALKIISKKTGRISSYCGKKECWMHFGIKRPEHSEYMKKIAKETTRLTGIMKKGELHNKNVNTDAFKKKVLDNKKIPYAEETFMKVYQEYLIQRNKNTRSKRYETLLKNLSSEDLQPLFKKYGKNLTLTESHFRSLDIEAREELFYDIHGVLTKYNEKKQHNGKYAGRFRRIFLTDLKHNTKVTSLICKSKYEESWIKFFEKNNIKWEYEPFTVAGKIRGTYTPDFLLEYNSRKVIMEVKGTLYGYPTDYMENKIEGCREYCQQRGYVFLFILNKKPSLNLINI